MASYDYLGQDIIATALIQPFDNDSFYNPVPLEHNGYGFDGHYYLAGVDLSAGYGLEPYGTSPYGVARPTASWQAEYTIAPNQFRGDQAAFPTYGLVLLSPAALTVLDESTPQVNANALVMWMEFLLNDTYALANNYNFTQQSFTPAGLAYANGKLSVIYNPDSGNLAGAGLPPAANSHMIVTIDFSLDTAYLDVALPGWKPNTMYALGTYIFDDNGNAQKVTMAGTSGSTQPTWNPVYHGITTDGSLSPPTGVVWTNEG
jgi:hypothetical protein